MQSLTTRIALDLPGLQAERPLSVALLVRSSLPTDMHPQASFVATVVSPGAVPHVSATRHGSTDQLLVAQASYLSSFHTVWLDGQAVARWLADVMAKSFRFGCPTTGATTQVGTVNE